MLRPARGRYAGRIVAIDPSAIGRPSSAHVSLHEAGALARSTRGLSSGTTFTMPSRASSTAAAPSVPERAQRTAASARAYQPHTPVSTTGTTDADQWDAMLNSVGAKYNVPPLFLKAVMLSESGGNPNAIGDSGHSVGLFQLHDQGYGHGMGDARFDPLTNADRAAQGLAEAWHAGERAGYTGEYAVRAAYDYSFNPGGGFAYQGDSVVAHYNQLLGDQGLPPLA